MQERLQKYLARCGLGSRRACEKLIEQGRISVDGVKATLGMSIDAEKDAVTFDRKPVVLPRALVYWMLNKPVGYVTTVSDPQGRPTVMQFLPKDLPRVFPIGRLDRDSQGLLLFTNDGELTQKLLHPSSKVWKRYHCGLEGKPTMATLKALSEGVELQDGKTAPCRVRWRGQYLEVELREGRKRQIRRMLGSVGHPVMWLKRVAVGRVELGSLPEAACRPLSKAEVEALRG